MEKNIVNPSLPNILFPSQSSQIIHLRRNQSLPCCLKFSWREISYNHKAQISIQMNSNTEEERLSPTIGELLGDNDRFHQRYQHYYTRSDCKRKRYSDHSHSRQKHRYSTSFKTPNKSPCVYPGISPDISQVYSYSPVYHYTPHLNYSYWSNTSPCLICDSYQGLYPTETMPLALY